MARSAAPIAASLMNFLLAIFGVCVVADLMLCDGVDVAEYYDWLLLLDCSEYARILVRLYAKCLRDEQWWY